MRARLLDSLIGLINSRARVVVYAIPVLVTLAVLNAVMHPAPKDALAGGPFICDGCGFPQKAINEPLAGDTLSGLPHICENCNVLLVTADTTRAEHLSCYGYAHETSPNIDGLGKDGILFTNMFAQAPLTSTSHVSIMTSLYPFQHGVRDNWGYALGDDAVTLAETLTDQGYDTAAFVSSYVLEDRFGLDQGFATYDDEMTAGAKNGAEGDYVHDGAVYAERRAEDTTDAAIQWLGNGRNGSFFMWVHYYDPHYGYIPPGDYARMFTSKTAEYDGEIRYMDDQLGRLLDRLEKLGLSQKTVIVFVGDHGEGLGDHGEPAHGKRVFDSTIRIPAIIKNPAHKGGIRVDRQLESIDIAPTVLSALAIYGGACMQGEDVYGIAGPDERLVYAETYLLERSAPETNIKAIRGRGLKYMRHSSGRWVLYDLDADIDEERPIKDADRGRGDMLDGFMAERGECTVETVRVGLGQKGEDKLRALGYIS